MPRRSSTNKLTPQVKAQIVQDFENGLDIEEITQRHGLTHAEYVRRIVKKEKGDDVLPPATPKEKRAKRMCSEDSDNESVHSYSLRPRTPRTPRNKLLTPGARFREQVDEETGQTISSRKKRKLLSPVAEPTTYEDVEMEDSSDEEIVVEHPDDIAVEDPDEIAPQELDENVGPSLSLTPQMTEQMSKRNSTFEIIGSGLKNITGTLFGSKSPNVSNPRVSLPGRRSVNLSPAFPSFANSASAHPEGLVEQSYVDDIVRMHKEELEQRDAQIAARDHRIAEQARQIRSLKSEIKQLQSQKELEKKWNKYF